MGRVPGGDLVQVADDRISLQARWMMTNKVIMAVVVILLIVLMIDIKTFIILLASFIISMIIVSIMSKIIEFLFGV